MCQSRIWWCIVFSVVHRVRVHVSTQYAHVCAIIYLFNSAHVLVHDTHTCTCSSRACSTACARASKVHCTGHITLSSSAPTSSYYRKQHHCLIWVMWFRSLCTQLVSHAFSYPRSVIFTLPDAIQILFFPFYIIHRCLASKFYFLYLIKSRCLLFVDISDD